MTGRLNQNLLSNDMSLTPHGPGFSFLDSFEITVAGREGLGRKWLDPRLPFFADHFPGRPLMPGVLLIECGAQTAGGLLAAMPGAEAPAHFPPAPGEQLKNQHPRVAARTIQHAVALEN